MRRLLGTGAAGVALLALPYLIADPYVLHIVITVLVFVGLTVAWNIPVYGGQISLGHGAFFGLGAYTSTLLFVNAGLVPIIGILPAVGIGVLAGLLLSVPLLRLKGPFFTLATIAFVEVLRRLTVYLRDLTRGSEGLTVPPDTGIAYLTFTDRRFVYYIAFALAALAVLASYRVYHSRMGFHLRAAAADEDAARALGVHTGRLRVCALLLSAALTAVLGVFWAQYVFVIDPHTFYSLETFSIQPALYGIIGGMGTVWGPVLGAVLMTPLVEILRVGLGGSEQGLAYFLYGVLLVVIVLVWPTGLLGAVARMRARLRGRGPGGAGRAAPGGGRSDRTRDRAAEGSRR